MGTALFVFCWLAAGALPCGGVSESFSRSVSKGPSGQSLPESGGVVDPELSISVYPSSKRWETARKRSYRTLHEHPVAPGLNQHSVAIPGSGVDIACPESGPVAADRLGIAGVGLVGRDVIA